MDSFKNLRERYFQSLDRFLPIVKRVHGPKHPEIFEVSKLYETIREKLKNGENNLDEEFRQLREITTNYQVPSDVCETYEGIYKMLEELDQAYKRE